MNSQQLFGGAITTTIKNTFVDASQFRQIPDNQEVFVDMTTQQSLIFELLEHVEATDQAIAKYHFQQLADDNEAAESIVNSIDSVNVKDIAPYLPQDTTEIHILQGTQKISKFNEKDAYNTVEIILAVVRLTNVSTDFVISVNAPVKLAPVSSEQESAQQVDAIDIDTAKQEVLDILKNLNVQNWELFG